MVIDMICIYGQNLLSLLHKTGFHMMGLICSLNNDSSCFMTGFALNIPGATCILKTAIHILDVNSYHNKMSQFMRSWYLSHR